eukprot:jgi/Tetstr1/423403/TSEL_014084.t1
MLDWDRLGVGDLTGFETTSGLRPTDRSRPCVIFDAGGVGGRACDYMIDSACVSSTTPTWGNDPCLCNPGIGGGPGFFFPGAQGAHQYYPSMVEDRGRPGKSTLTVVYIFAVLLLVRNFSGGCLSAPTS